MQTLRQAVGLLPVDDAEVHRLRAAAQLRGDLVDRDAENAAGGGGVEIGAGVESPDQARIAGKVREQPELDLGIVRRHEQPILANGQLRCRSIGRDEAFANMPAEFGAHRDVLQVRIG